MTNMKVNTKISECRRLGHDTCLDIFPGRFFVEDVYHCLTCRITVIEQWEGDEYITKHILPVDTPPKEITRLLTPLPRLQIGADSKRRHRKRKKGG